jgi:hypothetical protein
MISQPHTLPPKPAVSLEASAHFDVLWGKPVFRAPDLASRVNIPATTPFTIHRVTETRREAKA